MRPEGRAVPEALSGLTDLALNLAWTRTNASERIWSTMDAESWREHRNPWLILQTVSEERLEELARNEPFCCLVRADVDAQAAQHRATTWLESAGGHGLTCVAYFSLEFGLSEALPIYSGGLGVLAGDHLKAASDLGVPVVGVGLLYQQGYFRQVLDADGRQMELYPFNDPGDLPIQPVRSPDGGHVRIPLQLPGRVIWLRVWQAQVGRNPLYLLDFNDPRNLPADRGITSELYGGGPELRIQQELALGLGGWLLLQGLGLRPEVCHLNEGHAAFVTLARAKTFMDETGTDFEVALAATRPGNVFTTHTPVAAGFDRFDADLAAPYFAALAEWIGVDPERLLALGREDPRNTHEPFNMADLAIRGSGSINAVSRLHGRVSRALFAPLFPRWPLAEVPVDSITNGVHIPTWTSAEMDALYCQACGPGLWLGTDGCADEGLRGLSDEALWEWRARARRRLVEFARDRVVHQLQITGRPLGEIEAARSILDPNALTIGFARRFASYKRPNLLLADPDRLARLLCDPHRPVQLLVAGKAHPRDLEGKAMIEAWVRFVRRADVRDRAVFLSDYDLLLAERLVEGVDLWINTPRRPWEACGTSGMKVAVNGGLNLSELDGWWAEAWTKEVGWAIGDPDAPIDGAARDREEALALYDLLEREVVPGFYARDTRGVPAAWVGRMRESLAQLAPRFSSGRMVREYTERVYCECAAAVRRRSQDGGKLAAEIVAWRKRIDRFWPGVHIAHWGVEPDADALRVWAHVYLGDLEEDDVSVQAFADEGVGTPTRCVDLKLEACLMGATHAYQYEASLPVDRAASDYTVRVVPHHPDAILPLEAIEILWAR